VEVWRVTRGERERLVLQRGIGCWRTELRDCLLFFHEEVRRGLGLLLLPGVGMPVLGHFLLFLLLGLLFFINTVGVDRAPDLFQVVFASCSTAA